MSHAIGLDEPQGDVLIGERLVWPMRSLFRQLKSVQDEIEVCRVHQERTVRMSLAVFAKDALSGGRSEETEL